METAAPKLTQIYLVVDGDVIYEISPNTVLNIGRLDSNDIVLDDYKVSREHAVLKISRTDMLLVDLASTHGTYVNGEKIDRSPLKFGDTIQLVNHELTLFSELPEDLDDTKVIKPRNERSLDRRLKFFGGLNEFSLLTLVQFLHQEKQSGLLLLELGQHPARASISRTAKSSTSRRARISPSSSCASAMTRASSSISTTRKISPSAPSRSRRRSTYSTSAIRTTRRTRN